MNKIVYEDESMQVVIRDGIVVTTMKTLEAHTNLAVHIDPSDGSVTYVKPNGEELFLGSPFANTVAEIMIGQSERGFFTKEDAKVVKA